MFVYHDSKKNIIIKNDNIKVRITKNIPLRLFDEQEFL